MSDPITTIEYKGYHIDIYVDPDPQNPRTEWDNLGTMCCRHCKYDLGDNHQLELHQLRALPEKSDCISLPLYLYDHGGLSIQTVPFNDYWDSGQVGYIFMTKENAIEVWGNKYFTKRIKKLAEDMLIAEVKIYNDYLTGQVYGYQIRETGDGCWGFFGSDFKDNCLEESAKDEIETDLDREYPLFRINGVAV